MIDRNLIILLFIQQPICKKYKLLNIGFGGRNADGHANSAPQFPGMINKVKIVPIFPGGKIGF